MKWFLALNDSSPAFDYYAGMVQVAVRTARQHTRLDPVFIHDGADNRLTDWLADGGVRVVRRRSFLAGELEGLPGLDGNPTARAIAAGAYLRLEVPELVRELGWPDRHVLYTDCDVMFTAAYDAALEACAPAWFAVAPEHDPADPVAMNTGVMVMNVDALRGDAAAFRRTVRERLAESVQSSFDQHAYRVHYRGRWEHLPPVLNWKPYWGRNAAAQVIHFHGPKPFQKYAVAAGVVPPGLARLATGAFAEYAAEYDRLLMDAAAEPPEAADAFGDWTETSGLLPAEGPYPEQDLPRVRWGVAPRVVLRPAAFTGPRLVRITVLSQLEGQEISIRAGGTEIRRHVFRAPGGFERIRVELPAATAGDVIELVPARWRDDPDGQSRALLFRALRVEPKPN
ncbi:MAG TPA: hypothetical protein VHD61_06000 [Lacunisphaera sp.]|nr:hypothetical protein [Lacunisphaera sp.]